jgi:predicted O-methyltransferase YrrM
MTTSTVVRRFKLLVSLFSLLPKRPTEFYDLIGTHVDLYLDRLLGRTPEYESVGWETALAEMPNHFQNAYRFSDELGMREIEAHVSRRIQDIRGKKPWDLSLSSDLTLARCVYVLCRASNPTTVVETGVAYGLSSAFILKALEQNDHGTLYSVDLPPPGRGADDYLGILIPDALKPRWQFRRGASQRRLPGVLSQGEVDIFLHDSLHTYRNMQREFAIAWPHLKTGGVIISDDVDGNRAFEELRKKNLRYWRVLRQEGKSSLFGIAIKA